MDKLKDLTNKGTTTLGIATKEGIVLAADKRATMGYLIAHKEVQKIFAVTDNIALTTAGMVGDNQMLLRYLKTQMNLHEIKKGTKPTVKACATLLSHILYGNRFSPWPYYVQIIVGGYDYTGFSLYTLDPGASMIQDKYISTGSGSVVAYGVLQTNFRDNLTLEEAAKIAYKAIRAAIERDIGTGEAVDLVLITKDGCRFLDKNEIKKYSE